MSDRDKQQGVQADITPDIEKNSKIPVNPSTTADKSPKRYRPNARYKITPKKPDVSTQPQPTLEDPSLHPQTPGHQQQPDSRPTAKRYVFSSVKKDLGRALTHEPGPHIQDVDSPCSEQAHPVPLHPSQPSSQPNVEQTPNRGKRYKFVSKAESPLPAAAAPSFEDEAAPDQIRTGGDAAEEVVLSDSSTKPGYSATQSVDVLDSHDCSTPAHSPSISLPSIGQPEARLAIDHIETSIETTTGELPTDGKLISDPTLPQQLSSSAEVYQQQKTKKELDERLLSESFTAQRSQLYVKLSRELKQQHDARVTRMSQTASGSETAPDQEHSGSQFATLPSTVPTVTKPTPGIQTPPQSGSRKQKTHSYRKDTPYHLRHTRSRTSLQNTNIDEQLSRYGPSTSHIRNDPSDLVQQLSSSLSDAFSQMITHVSTSFPSGLWPSTPQLSSQHHPSNPPVTPTVTPQRLFRDSQQPNPSTIIIPEEQSYDALSSPLPLDVVLNQHTNTIKSSDQYVRRVSLSGSSPRRRHSPHISSLNNFPPMVVPRTTAAPSVIHPTSPLVRGQVSPTVEHETPAMTLLRLTDTAHSQQQDNETGSPQRKVTVKPRRAITMTPHHISAPRSGYLQPLSTITGATRQISYDPQTTPTLQPQFVSTIPTSIGLTLLSPSQDVSDNARMHHPTSGLVPITPFLGSNRGSRTRMPPALTPPDISFDMRDDEFAQHLLSHDSDSNTASIKSSGGHQTHSQSRSLSQNNGDDTMTELLHAVRKLTFDTNDDDPLPNQSPATPTPTHASSRFVSVQESSDQQHGASPTLHQEHYEDDLEENHQQAMLQTWDIFQLRLLMHIAVIPQKSPSNSQNSISIQNLIVSAFHDVFTRLYPYFHHHTLDILTAVFLDDLSPSEGSTSILINCITVLQDSLFSTHLESCHHQFDSLLSKVVMRTQEELFSHVTHLTDDAQTRSHQVTSGEKAHDHQSLQYESSLVLSFYQTNIKLRHHDLLTTACDQFEQIHKHCFTVLIHIGVITALQHHIHARNDLYSLPIQLQETFPDTIDQLLSTIVLTVTKMKMERFTQTHLAPEVHIDQILSNYMELMTSSFPTVTGEDAALLQDLHTHALLATQQFLRYALELHFHVTQLQNGLSESADWHTSSSSPFSDVVVQFQKKIGDLHIQHYEEMRKRMQEQGQSPDKAVDAIPRELQCLSFRSIPPLSAANMTPEHSSLRVITKDMIQSFCGRNGMTVDDLLSSSGDDSTCDNLVDDELLYSTSSLTDVRWADSYTTALDDDIINAIISQVLAQEIDDVIAHGADDQCEYTPVDEHQTTSDAISHEVETGEDLLPQSTLRLTTPLPLFPLYTNDIIIPEGIHSSVTITLGDATIQPEIASIRSVITQSSHAAESMHDEGISNPDTDDNDDHNNKPITLDSVLDSVLLCYERAGFSYDSYDAFICQFPSISSFEQLAFLYNQHYMYSLHGVVRLLCDALLLTAGKIGLKSMSLRGILEMSAVRCSSQFEKPLFISLKELLNRQHEFYRRYVMECLDNAVAPLKEDYRYGNISPQHRPHPRTEKQSVFYPTGPVYSLPPALNQLISMSNSEQMSAAFADNIDATIPNLLPLSLEAKEWFVDYCCEVYDDVYDRIYDQIAEACQTAYQMNYVVKYRHQADPSFTIFDPKVLKLSNAYGQLSLDDENSDQTELMDDMEGDNSDLTREMKENIMQHRSQLLAIALLPVPQLDPHPLSGSYGYYNNPSHIPLHKDVAAPMEDGQKVQGPKQCLIDIFLPHCVPPDNSLSANGHRTRHLRSRIYGHVLVPFYDIIDAVARYCVHKHPSYATRRVTVNYNQPNTTCNNGTKGDGVPLQVVRLHNRIVDGIFLLSEESTNHARMAFIQHSIQSYVNFTSIASTPSLTTLLSSADYIPISPSMTNNHVLQALLLPHQIHNTTLPIDYLNIPPALTAEPMLDEHNCDSIDDLSLTPYALNEGVSAHIVSTQSQAQVLIPLNSKIARESYYLDINHSINHSHDHPTHDALQGTYDERLESRLKQFRTDEAAIIEMLVDEVTLTYIKSLSQDELEALNQSLIASEAASIYT